MAFSSDSTLQQTDEVSAVASGGSGGGGGGGVSTWDALSDKPTVLTPPGFSAGNFPSAEALAAADIATALSHSPGLSGGIRTKSEGVRSGGNETDTALVTEAAVRAQISSTVETLPDLGDVSSAVQADGNVLASGGAAYREESIASLVADHTVLANVGNVVGSAASGTEGQALILGDPDSDSTLEWVARSVSEQIRKDGDLSIGDVSIAGSSRVIKQPNEPTQRPNGDPLQDGDIWIDTDASPVPEAQVYRDGAFRQTTTAIAGSNIVTGAVNADKIKADTITASEIEANSITATEIATGTLTADEIEAGTITSDKIKAGTITANEISAGTVTANEVAANSITAGEITAGTITATQIQTGTLTADEISAGAITANEVDADSVRAELLSGNTGTITNVLEVGDQSPFIRIDGPNARVESSSFASGVSGFRLDADGFLEADDARIRGELQSTVVKKEEVTVTGGQQVWAPATQLDPAGDTPTQETFSITGVNSRTDALEIQYRDATDRLPVEDTSVADVGEKVRLKSSLGEDIRTIQSIDGSTFVVGEPIINEWPNNTVVTRWEDRIRNVTDTASSPFTSYVSRNSEEVARIGNVSGRSGLTGYGIALGKDNQLTYSTQSNTLSVSGRLESPTGNIGAFQITGGGLRSGRLKLDPANEQVLFLDPGADDLTGQITSSSFSSGLQGWTITEGNWTTKSDSTDGDYVESREGIIDQSGIDATGQEGSSARLTVEFDFDTVSGPEGQFGDSISYEPTLRAVVLNGDTGDVIASRNLEENTNAPNFEDTLLFDIPSSANVADNLQVRLAVIPPDDDDAPSDPPGRFYDVSLTTGAVRARYRENEAEFFDSSGSLLLRVNPNNQEFEFGNGARLFGDGTGGIRAEDNNGNGATVV